MVTKQDIIEQAYKDGFEDVGFTTADPFDEHKDFLLSRKEEYGWAEAVGLDLINGTDPKSMMPEGQTIIVLLDVYFQESFPSFMESHFGRCYLDDDRVTRDGLTQRIKSFRSYLRDSGIQSKVPFNLPHRAAATRAGMGTLGKNCLFYSNTVARQSSWNLPIAIVIDKAYPPDEPTVEIGCPDWCRNVCIAACPTRALKGKGTIDPTKCISFLTYFGSGITPKELRAPMGLYIYGCDRCQNVCPRNSAWLAKELPLNMKVKAKTDFFDLSKLLHMDKEYFEKNIWPHMFYMSYDDIWRWKMNVARVMGNTLDEVFIDDLTRAFQENQDERTKGMIAWALGRIGGKKSKKALDDFAKVNSGLVLNEIQNALECISP